MKISELPKDHQPLDERDRKYPCCEWNYCSDGFYDDPKEREADRLRDLYYAKQLESWHYSKQLQELDSNENQ